MTGVSEERSANQCVLGAGLDTSKPTRQTAAMSVQVINPANGLPLRREGDALIDQRGSRFPIVRGVPRLCDEANYAANFGMQWNAFRLTQIDRGGGTFAPSEQRFFAETGWQADQLAGQNLLEVGSGAGRFTRVVLQRTRANLYSVDFSTAVEANLETNRDLADGRLHLFQASIYDMPFPDGSFDKVFCLGVLQHTPSFERSVRILVEKTKPGGEIVVDFYPIRGWWTKFSAKYFLRPFTKRMAHERLLASIERNIDWLITAHKGLTRSGLGALTRFLPIVDLRTLPPGLSPAEEREWAVLDTFDIYSPEFDNPQRLDRVADMFRRNGADVTFAAFVDNGSSLAPVIRAIRR
jgi:SAM-dependent methyltransferase